MLNIPITADTDFKRINRVIMSRAAATLLIIVVSAGIACSNSRDITDGCPGISNGDTRAFREGWCDTHTFRVSAAASPSLKEIDPVKRKKTSYARAVVSAKYLIRNKFIAARMQGLGTSIDDSSRRARDMRFRKFLDDVLDTGIVIRHQWDQNDNCEVFFQIKRTGLKKRIEANH